MRAILVAAAIIFATLVAAWMFKFDFGSWRCLGKGMAVVGPK
jgi:hypothetical protein